LQENADREGVEIFLNSIKSNYRFEDDISDSFACEYNEDSQSFLITPHNIMVGNIIDIFLLNGVIDKHDIINCDSNDQGVNNKKII
jgi:hypothetical protein